MNNEPIGMTYAELAAVLRDMAERVEQGDSFEGSIEYLMPAPDDGLADEHHVWVRAAYRVGNTMGQGGMRMIGEIR